MTVRYYETKLTTCAICLEPHQECAHPLGGVGLALIVEGVPVTFDVCESCVRNMAKPFLRAECDDMRAAIELNADEAERFAKMLDDDSPPGPALRALFAKAEPEAKATTCQRCGAAAAYDGAVYCGAACCALSEDGR